MTDCLIIGYNDENFDEYEKMLRAMGTEHPDYRDLNINCIQYNGQSYRALDILDYFYHEGRQDSYRRFHNADLLWNVILYLGTYLHRRGFSFDYINLFQMEKDKLREKLVRDEILTVVITTTVYTMVNPIYEAITFIRQYNTSAKIIVGGPFISKQAERMDAESLQTFAKYLNADFLVLSREGEGALAQILSALKKGGPYGAINNIAYKDGERYYITPVAKEYNPLNENPIDYSLFPKEDIGEFINIRISKGCPFACAYCGFPLRSEGYHYLDVDSIERDLNAIREVGTVKSLFFLDDSVNIPKSNFKAMLRMMIRQKYDFAWHCFLRCDQCDEETIELMKEAGCEGVFLGLESANATVLKNMNKTSRQEHFAKTIPLFKAAGMIVFTSIFIGFPGETHRTFQETIDFLRETGSDFYRPQLWYCDPITPVWQQREKYGLRGYNFGWSHHTMDAKTACDLTEKSFFLLDEPVWAPDPGFNFISVYYLKHRGMPVEQIKTFLKCFNAVVKEKLLFPERKEASPELIESLRKSCQFDRGELPDMRPVEALSAERYIRAEQYWRDEFGYPDSKGHYEPLPTAVDTELELSQTIELERPLLQELNETYGAAEFNTVVFAAVCILKARGDGREELAVLNASDRHGLVPMKLNNFASLSVRQLMGLISEKIEAARPHQLFAFHIFYSNGWLRNQEPFFAMSFLKSEGEEFGLDQWLAGLDSRVRSNLGLKVKFDIDSSQTIHLKMRYRSDLDHPERLDMLIRQLGPLLESISRDPELKVSEIAIVEARELNPVGQFAAKQFNF
jgi:anaerobic magnesium-protoporphyrin IX monomethyl ester cyclase